MSFVTIWDYIVFFGILGSIVGGIYILMQVISYFYKPKYKLTGKFNIFPYQIPKKFGDIDHLKDDLWYIHILNDKIYGNNKDLTYKYNKIHNFFREIKLHYNYYQFIYIGEIYNKGEKICENIKLTLSDKSFVEIISQNGDIILEDEKKDIVIGNLNPGNKVFICIYSYGISVYNNEIVLNHNNGYGKIKIKNFCHRNNIILTIDKFSFLFKLLIIPPFFVVLLVIYKTFF